LVIGILCHLDERIAFFALSGGLLHSNQWESADLKYIMDVFIQISVVKTQTIFRFSAKQGGYTMNKFLD
jgi:hypothetical protein